MEDTAKSVQELKVLIRELILEIGELKERVTILEREKTPPAAYNEKHDKLDIIKLQGEGYERLGQLYNDGYHVCPANFGYSREGDCLFCLALILKE
ncbi:Initiation control protein, YabA [Syntrophomonas zehnderi OL-4]|uniref:Initiation control protein, YabA n=1 Tax=Syntrophomonas zehnderi OL-4 TaxID=690567 RepID=A0A0E4GC19_9FIRM|nr:initiation control protein YabA [Syntrophomonas zehnderi]CFY01219.1 Initiation control protein, YabA [Syntrophomonas zehnderi OL-4]